MQQFIYKLKKNNISNLKKWTDGWTQDFLNTFFFLKRYSTPKNKLTKLKVWTQDINNYGNKRDKYYTHQSLSKLLLMIGNRPLHEWLISNNSVEVEYFMYLLFCWSCIIIKLKVNISWTFAWQKNWIVHFKNYITLAKMSFLFKTEIDVWNVNHSSKEQLFH